MKQYSGLLRRVLGNEKITVNTNKELDLIGVDLISHPNNVADITVENIYKKMNFIDIKTSFNDGINLDARALIKPNYKANNLFVCQFMNNLSDMSHRQLANKVIDWNYLSPRGEHSSTAHILDKEKLYNAIYENITKESLEEGYNFFQQLRTSGYRDEQLLQQLFKYDEDTQFYTDINGILRADIVLGDGITLCATPKQITIRLDKNFISKYFPNSELTYANIKENKLIY